MHRLGRRIELRDEFDDVTVIAKIDLETLDVQRVRCRTQGERDDSAAQCFLTPNHWPSFSLSFVGHFLLLLIDLLGRLAPWRQRRDRGEPSDRQGCR